MFWDVYRHYHHGPSVAAAEAARSGQYAEREVKDLRRTVQALEEQVERLTLVAVATTELLRDRLGVPDDAIEEKVREIDLRDGRLDGKIGGTLQHCPGCNRVNGPRRATCLYCGKGLPRQSLPIGLP
jgi:hypothetical protein